MVREATPCREADHGRFEVTARDGFARLGRLHTSTHVLATPALLPVINPNIRTIEPQAMWEMGFEALITNSYVIWKHDRLKTAALEDGVHALLDYPGVIMTDSGTFQSYVYGDVEVGVEEIVEFQREIGVDIATMLDIFGTPQMSREEVEDAVRVTAERGPVSIETAGTTLLNGPIQGGIHSDLRQRSAELMGAQNFDVHPIGGIVPLMEKQRYRELVEIILACRTSIPVGRPIHMFGCGHPHLFPICVALGADLFDSAAYALFAKDDRLLMPWGTVHLGDLTHWPYMSAALSQKTPDEVRRMPRDEKTALLAQHNLEVTLAEMNRCRQAVKDGTIWRLVEERSHTNAALREATLWLYDNLPEEIIAETCPLGEGGFHWSDDAPDHPRILSARHALHERWSAPDEGAKHVVLYGKNGPWRDRCGQLAEAILMRWPSTQIFVATPLGVLPFSLEDINPWAHVVGPDALHADFDADALAEDLAALVGREVEEVIFIEMGTDKSEVLEALGDALGDAAALDDSSSATARHVREVRAIAEKVALFTDLDLDAAEAWLAGATFVHSRTGRVRNVMTAAGDHVLRPRMRDGGLSLTLAGAAALHAMGGLPTVQVDDDAAPFARKGRNVMHGFILGATGTLRPGLPCAVTDGAGTFLAHGTALCAERELLAFRKGIAVKVRDGIGE